jgi:hypothetical protein
MVVDALRKKYGEWSDFKLVIYLDLLYRQLDLQ